MAQLAEEQQYQQLEQLALQSGITGEVRIDSTEFIRQIVFDPLRGVDQPKARFSYLFPTSDSALIQVRLKPSLSSAQQAAAIADIPPGRADAEVPPVLRRHLHGERRSRRGQRSGLDDHRIDLAASGRRADRHGDHAEARLPQPASAPPAGHRPRRLRDHLRSRVTGRRNADHGLDRGAADPHRPGRRLRDPVPVTRAGGPSGRGRGQAAL